MEKKIIEPRTLKGFRDFAPKEQLARQAMFAKIQTVFERFGFLPLSTPVLEYKEILMGKYGDDEKLVYSFKDNGDRDVAMRYDLTVPMARFVAQNQSSLTLPFKRYQIAPVWRADNTQKGRSREFYQCDVDIVGTSSPLADAEVVACLYNALVALGISGMQVKFNNRMLFSRVLKVSSDERVIILRGVDKLDKVGMDGVVKYLQDNQVSEAGIEQAQKILGLGEGKEAIDNLATAFTDEASVTQAVTGALHYFELAGIPSEALVFSPTTVRGLDYYTNMVFEIVIPGSGYGSIAGGGRYDGLVDTFSNTPLPAVGGSIGIDRLFEYLEEQNLLNSSPAVQALIVNQDEALEFAYVELLTSLRRNGINSELYYEPLKLDKQFKYAETKEVPFAVIMGQEEKNSGVVQVKNLKTREQVEIQTDALVSYLKS